MKERTLAYRLSTVLSLEEQASISAGAQGENHWCLHPTMKISNANLSHTDTVLDLIVDI